MGIYLGQATGQITAASGRVTWRTQEVPIARVYVSMDGGEPKVMSQELFGSHAPKWLLTGRYYTFVLVSVTNGTEQELGRVSFMAKNWVVPTPTPAAPAPGGPPRESTGPPRESTGPPRESTGPPRESTEPPRESTEPMLTSLVEKFPGGIYGLAAAGLAAFLVFARRPA